MVSSRLSIRKYSSTIPSWCIVPPINPPVIPPTPWPLDTIAGHFHIQWYGGKGDFNEYDWDFAALRLLPDYPHTWHVITSPNGITLELTFVAHDLYDFLDIAFNDATGSGFFDGTHLDLPTAPVFSHYDVASWDPINPWNAEALLSFDY